MTNMLTTLPPTDMSMSHTRSKLGKMVPQVSDILFDQKRYPILKFTEDTSPGVHDTLSPACDRWLYAELGVRPHHVSCFDNYWNAFDRMATGPLAEDIRQMETMEDRVKDKELIVAVNAFSVTSDSFPDPLHLFRNMHIDHGPWVERVELELARPVSKAGDLVRFEAMRDVVVVMSTCPQDVLLSKGKSTEPVQVHYEVIPKEGDEHGATNEGDHRPRIDSKQADE